MQALSRISVRRTGLLLVEDKETIVKLKDEIIATKNEQLESVSTTVLLLRWGIWRSMSGARQAPL